MTLVLGTRIGPYEIAAQIGVGGMGEVYRATDTNLKRQVALKVLPTSLANVPERLARFQREAEVLAALNHPNIAAIYGLEKSGPTTALVMELVEGPTLADRIAQGRVPVEEVLAIARQIADALAAAHDQGIVHRDLKPANIKVRPDGTVKVLDFGLAKAMEPAVAVSPEIVTQLPTITTPAMTQMGMVLGTAAYMSPEQAKGRRVDQQTDVWALGAVLFEMLSGRRAFEGDGVAETLAAVLRSEVDWKHLPADVPPRVVLVIRRCLQKAQKERFGHVQDVRLALDGAFDTATVESASRRSMAVWRLRLVAAALVAGILGVVGTMITTQKPVASIDARVSQRLSVVTPADRPVAFGWSPGRSLAISPDGTRIVFVATRADVPGDSDSQNLLVLRELGSGISKDLPGTAGARQPFFSPDGQWVGFFTNAALKKVSLAGGNPVTVAEPVVNGRWGFGAWTKDDQIVFSIGELGLHRVPAAGGAPSVVVAPDAKSGERYLRPLVIPGTDAVLFDVLHFSLGRIRVEAVHLSSGERKVVVENLSVVRYLPTGHLLLEDDGIVVAPFDAHTLSLSGSLASVPENIRRDLPFRGGTPQLAVSDTGTMIYAPSVDGSRRLGLVDGTGVFQPLGVPADDIEMATVSPDGQLVAFVRLGPPPQVYVYDRMRGSTLKLTQSGREYWPAWHPNGRAVAVSAGTPAGEALVVKEVDGSQRTLYTGEGIALLRSPSWSPDGTRLAFTIQRESQQDIWVSTTGAAPKAEPFLDGPAIENFPRFSPDGHWLAYVSNESGRLETYVRRYPAGEKILASVAGGGPPVWSRDGRTLYFQHLANDKPEIVAVPMISSPAGLRAGTPRRVLEMQTPSATGELAEYLRSSDSGQRWDVLPDGRFLMIRGAAQQTGSREIAVVQNWFEDVKRLAPSK